MVRDGSMTYTLGKLLPQHLPVLLIGHGEQVVYIFQMLAALIPPRLVEAAADGVDYTRGVGIAVHDCVRGDAEEGAYEYRESVFHCFVPLPLLLLGIRTIFLLQSMIVIRHSSVPRTLHQNKPGERGQEGTRDVTKLPPLSDIADNEVGEVKHHSGHNQSDWRLRSTTGQASDMVQESHAVKCF